MTEYNERQAMKDLIKASTIVTRQAELIAKGKDVPNLCAEYARIKPLLASILWLVALIPGYGKKIADVIAFLRRIADAYCGA